MDAGQDDSAVPTPFVRFSREEWGRLQAGTSLSLSEDDVRELRRIVGHLTSVEAMEVYLPLSWLLYLHVSATQDLYRRAHAFLGNQATEVPYVVGIAGSVAAGKSTVARALQALISRWPSRPKVDSVSTDGFLYPNTGPAPGGIGSHRDRVFHDLARPGDATRRLDRPSIRPSAWKTNSRNFTCRVLGSPC